MARVANIVIISNTRAEAGPLASVIAALPEAKVIGLPPALQRGDPASVMAAGLRYFTDRLQAAGAKVVVVLGDRYETLAAALAATFLRIKLVHIHGGETTTGAFDDALRHSITHLTHTSGGHHCVATAEAAERVWDMLGGPDAGASETITCVGAPGLDGVPGNSATRDQREILVCFHPVTRQADYGLADCKAMIEALKHSSFNGYRIRMSMPNNDPGRDAIYEYLDHYRQSKMAVDWSDDDHAQYVARMQSAAFCVGNSSAFVIEAPWVGIPSVNIGDRQAGRPCAPSVVHAGAFDHLHHAMWAARDWQGPWAPCYKGEAAPRIAEIVRGMV